MLALKLAGFTHTQLNIPSKYLHDVLATFVATVSKKYFRYNKNLSPYSFLSKKNIPKSISLFTWQLGIMNTINLFSY